MIRSIGPSLTKLVRKAPRAMYGLFSLLVLLLVVANTVIYIRDRDATLAEAMRDRRSSVTLAAAVVEERLSRVVVAASAHAEGARFVERVDAGDWEGAIASLSGVAKILPYVDGIAVYDKGGAIKASSRSGAPADPGEAAVDDWFVGATKSEKPFVSSAYRSSIGGEMDRLAVAVRVASSTRDAAGFLVFEVDLEELLGWNREVSFGRQAVPYFVDRSGRIALQADREPYTEAGAVGEGAQVAKALRGEVGADVVPSAHDGSRDIVAYSPIDSFGWAVVTVQPMQIALEQFNSSARMNVGVQIATALACLLLLVIMVIALQRLGFLRKWESGYIHSSADALVAIDYDWTVTLWNPAAEKLTGWSRREAMGKPFRELVKFVRERDRSENVLFISDAMLSGQARFASDNTILIAKDGKEIPVSDSAAPIQDGNGKTIGAVVVFRDTTRERGEAMIKSSFAYAHHQLRTPVTAAMWNIELALEDCDDKVLKERIRKALVSMESVKKLVNELIEVSELEHGIIVPKVEEIDLKGLVAQVAGQLKEKADERKVKIAVAPIPPSATLASDQKLLTRAIYEMLDNAVVYSLPKGKVDLRASQTEHGIVFEIEDRGIGIPPEQQGIVYTKFFRGHNIPPESVGAGLGLHIASELTKLLGGKMWFRSEEGAGTTFYISLPARK